MKSSLAIGSCLAAVAALAVVSSASAAPLDGPALAASASPAAQAAPADVAADFGTGTNILQIPAAAFASRNTSGTIEYSGSGYVTQTGGLSDSMWAPIFLPTGASISWLDLYSYDADAASNITATIRMWTGYGTAAPPTFTDLITTASAGSSGYQYTSGWVLPAHIVNNDVRYGSGAQYSVVITTVPGNTNLRWKAVDIWWSRAIAPAPATASFTDVPTTAQFFREVEALAASGITQGCTATTFCPDATVTRRQMAAFLARAMGLGYSY
jgi:hypothetical protein